MALTQSFTTQWPKALWDSKRKRYIQGYEAAECGHRYVLWNNTDTFPAQVELTCTKCEKGTPGWNEIEQVEVPR